MASAPTHGIVIGLNTSWNSNGGQLFVAMQVRHAVDIRGGTLTSGISMSPTDGFECTVVITGADSTWNQTK